MSKKKVIIFTDVNISICGISKHVGEWKNTTTIKLTKREIAKLRKQLIPKHK